MPPAKLSEEQRAEIIALNASDPKHYTTRRLAEHYDVSSTTIWYLFNPTKESERRKVDLIQKAHARAAKGHSIAFRQRIDADAQPLFNAIPKDTRDLTGWFCGDPLPGRSALDQRQGRAP